jgi:hypothetical protein
LSENTQNFVGSMEVPERHRFDTAALERFLKTSCPISRAR